MKKLASIVGSDANRAANAGLLSAHIRVAPALARTAPARAGAAPIYPRTIPAHPGSWNDVVSLPVAG